MPAAGSCRVCSHAKREQIEGKRGAGVSWKDLSHEFALPVSTLRDHFKRCKVGEPRPARREAAPPPPADLVLPAVELPPDDPQAALLSELRYVHGRALEAYERAVLAKDDRTIALLVQQLRNNLKAQSDIIAKARRDDRPPAERLRENPEFAAFSRALFDALDRVPEAKAPIREALEAFVAEAS